MGVWTGGRQMKQQQQIIESLLLFIYVSKDMKKHDHGGSTIAVVLQ